MVAWNKTEGFEYFNWVCHMLSAAAIFYLLVRHALLLSGHLGQEEMQCGDCTRGCISSTRSRCDKSLAVKNRVVRAKRKMKGSKLHVKVIFYCTFGSLFWYLVYCLNGAMILMSQADIGWLPFAYCRFAKTVAAMEYGTAKACMYGVLIARLYVGFHGTAYAIRKRVVFGAYAILGIGIVVFVSFNAIFYRGEKYTVNSNSTRCVTKAPIELFVAGSMFDVVFTVCVVYTFVSSLNKMLMNFAKHMDTDDTEHNAEVYLLPIKYTLLSSVATISTMCAAALFALAGAHFLLALDCVLNSAALVLMTGRWMPAFWLLCTPMLKCMAHTPCLPCASLSEAELIELAAGKRKIAKKKRDTSENESDFRSVETDFSL